MRLIHLIIITLSVVLLSCSTPPVVTPPPREKLTLTVQVDVLNSGGVRTSLPPQRKLEGQTVSMEIPAESIVSVEQVRRIRCTLALTAVAQGELVRVNGTFSVKPRTRAAEGIRLPSDKNFTYTVPFGKRSRIPVRVLRETVIGGADNRNRAIGLTVPSFIHYLDILVTKPKAKKKQKPSPPQPTKTPPAVATPLSRQPVQS